MKLPTVDANYSEAVECPQCGGNNLHQASIAVEHDLSVRYKMFCEGCGRLPSLLAIHHHKGCTFIEWVEDGTNS